MTPGAHTVCEGGWYGVVETLTHVTRRGGSEVTAGETRSRVDGPTSTLLWAGDVTMHVVGRHVPGGIVVHGIEKSGSWAGWRIDKNKSLKGTEDGLAR